MTGLSRRSVLQVGGVAAVAVGARPALALPPPAISMGIADTQFPQFATAIHGASGIRLFVDGYGLVPGVWPTNLPTPTSLLGGPVVPPGAQTVMSIRPWPADLLSGKLDAVITGLCHSAPQYSSLSAWHENGPGNPLGYPPEVNQASVSRAVHEKMQRLCAGTGVLYGSIICAPAGATALWNGRHLDWYGIDTYLFPKYQLPGGKINWLAWHARQAKNMIAWRALSGSKHPVIKVAETNSPLDGNRSEWFTGVAAWLSSIGGNAMLTFWGSGGLSGPWPPSEGVMDTLAALARKYYLRRMNV